LVRLLDKRNVILPDLAALKRRAEGA